MESDSNKSVADDRSLSETEDDRHRRRGDDEDDDEKQSPLQIGVETTGNVEKNIYEAMMLANKKNPQHLSPHQLFNFQSLSEQQFKLISQFYSDFRACAAAATSQVGGVGSSGGLVAENSINRLNEDLVKSSNFQIFNENNL